MGDLSFTYVKDKSFLMWIPSLLVLNAGGVEEEKGWMQINSTNLRVSIC